MSYYNRNLSSTPVVSGSSKILSQSFAGVEADTEASY